MNLKSLQVFLAVAETGSFRKAADRVHRSQSAVSMQIKHLEEQLGVALFHRTTRQVRLTAEGDLLLGAARRAMAELDVGFERIREALDMQTGRLTLGCVPTVASSVLPAILSAYQRDFPGIAITLRELSATDLVQAVVRQDVEFGIGPAVPWAGDIAFQPIATDPIWALVPAEVLAAEADAIPFAALSRLPLLMYAQSAALRAQLEGEFAARGLRPDIRCETLHAGTLVALARAGLGVAVLPRVSVPARLGRSLRAVPIVEPRFERSLGIVKLRGQSLSPAASQLARMIDAHLGGDQVS